MRTGRPKVPITLSKEENEQLKSIATSRSLPYRLVKRARLILMAAEGTPNLAIAQKNRAQFPNGLQMAPALCSARTIGPP
jgi:hypothetical protein